MKHLPFFLFFGLFFACQQNNDDAGVNTNQPEGQAQGLLNGVNTIFDVRWNPPATGDTLFSVYLISKTRDGDGYFKTINILDIPLRTGMFPLNTYQYPAQDILNARASQLLGDVVGNSYDLFIQDDLSDLVTVTSYDPVKKEVKGELQASFWVDPSAPLSGLDTFRLENCVFDIPVK